MVTHECLVPRIGLVSVPALSIGKGRDQAVVAVAFAEAQVRPVPDRNSEVGGQPIQRALQVGDLIGSGACDPGEDHDMGDHFGSSPDHAIY